MNLRAFLFTGVLSVAVLVVPAGFAQEKLNPELNSLRPIDTDRDGNITREEWNRYFADKDENRDGILSKEEVEVGIREAPRVGPFPPDPAVDALFTKLDQDKDGMITQAEWTGSKRHFRHADADGDGKVSQQEFRSPKARFWNQLFEEMDTNADRIITSAEWLDTEDAFKRLDRDRDGVITGREFYKLW